MALEPMAVRMDDPLEEAGGSQGGAAAGAGATSQETKFGFDGSVGPVHIVVDSESPRRTAASPVGMLKAAVHGGAGVANGVNHALGRVGTAFRGASAITQAKIEQARVRFQRRFLRVTITCAIWLVLVLVWFAVDTSRVFKVSNTLNLNEDLQIDVAGCDVKFTSGAPEVSLKYSLFHQGHAGSFALDFDTSTTSVQAVYARSGDCTGNPNDECHPTCEVTVRLPATPAPGGYTGTIKVNELGQNLAQRIVVRVDPGTVLSVSSVLVRGEVIAVEADTPVVRGLDFRVGKGSLDVANATAFENGAASARLQSQSGNVHVSGVGAVNYTVGARQPDSRYALKVFGGTAGFTDVDTLPGSACGLDGDAAAQRKVISYYDTNGDGLVSVDEFKTVMQTNIPKCCSAQCPKAFMWDWQRAADCDDVASAVFSDVSSLPLDATGRSRYGFVTGQDFYDRLVNVNDTGLINLCQDQATLDDDSGAASATMSLSLWALQGEILFDHYRTTSGGVQVLRGDPDRPVALRLLSDTATELRAIADEFGNRNNVKEDLWLNIVVHDPQYRGFGATRTFVYASRPVFLYLTPPYLALCGGFLVLPRIHTVHAYITAGPEIYAADQYNASSLVNTSNGVTTTAGNVELIQIYSQIERALTPPGQLSLKGQLVRMESVPGDIIRHRFLTLANGITVSGTGDVEISTGDGDNIETIVETTEERAEAIIFLNLAISALLGVALTYAIHVHGKSLIRSRYREQRATAIYDSPVSDLQKTGPSHVVDPTSPWFTVFEMPIELINIILPYRKWTMHSLKKFCAQQVKLDESGHVPYQEFVEQYGNFCFDRELQQEHDEMRVREYLYTELPLYQAESVCGRRASSAAKPSRQYSTVSKINPDRRRAGAQSHPVSMEMTTVAVLRGVRLTDSIGYIRSGEMDPTKIARQLRESEKSIPTLGALGGLCELHDGYRAEITKLADRGLQVTAFPRKRAAVERNTRLLDDITRRPEFSAPDAAADPELATVRAFLKYCCNFEQLAVIQAVDGSDTGGGFDDTTTALQGFEVSVGEFFEALAEFASFCQEHGLRDQATGAAIGAMPALSSVAELADAVAANADAVSVFQSPMASALLAQCGPRVVTRRRRVINGIRWKALHETSFLTSRFTKEICIDACVYTLALLIPVCLFVGGAFHAQLVYSRTTGLVQEGTVAANTIAELEFRPEDEYYLPAYILIVSAVCTTVVLALRLLSHYFDVQKGNLVFYVWVKAVAYLLSAVFLGAVTYVVMICLWVVVGTVLNPNRNLVSGVALVVIALVLYHTVIALVNYRRIVKARIGQRLDTVLAERVQATFNDLREKQEDKLKRDALAAYAPEDKTITIGDLFDLLDESSKNSSAFDDSTATDNMGDGRTLDFVEFCNMFDLLGFGISEHDKQLMFAFADRNNRGELLPAEFADAWEYLKEAINRKVARKVGLSDGDIFYAVGFILVIFILTIPFLLTTIALWTNQGTFETVVWTLFVGTTGLFASTRTQTVKQNVEASGFLDKVIDAAINNLA